MIAGNLLILLLTVLVFWICRTVYKRTGSLIQYTVLVSVGFWLLTTGIPNFFVLLSPVTTLTRGAVLNRVSKKPVAGAHVYAEWRIGSKGLTGEASSPYKSYSTVTNDKGEFSLPHGFKPFSFWLIPVYERYFDSLNIKVINNDYCGDINYKQDADDIRMSLDPIVNADEYVRCLNNYPGELLAKGLDNFEKKFSYSQIRHKADLKNLARLYEKQGRYPQAIAAYEEVRRRGPSGSSDAGMAVHEIERIRQLHTAP